MKGSVVVLLLLACWLSYVCSHKGIESSNLIHARNDYPSNSNSTTNATTPWFDKIFIVVLGHQSYDAATREEYLRRLTTKGTLLVNYRPVSRNTQPSYIAMLAGDRLNVTDDYVHNVSGTSIVDLFESHGITWKAYIEDLPSTPCFTPNASSDNSYLRRHNPFISFDNIRNNQTVCARIVNANTLASDLRERTLPRYSFYIPNANHAGYSSDVAVAGKWLDEFLAPFDVDDEFWRGMLLVVTFDTSGDLNVPIYTLLQGGMIPSSHLDNSSYTHYSLLKLIETQFSLPSLGRGDDSATVIDPANFYPGTIIDDSRGLSFYFGIGLISFAGVWMLGGLVYYVMVVRRRRLRSRVEFVDMEEKKGLITQEIEDAEADDDGIDESRL